MFEREIQFIYDFNHNKLRKLGSFITFEQLSGIDLHPAILQYISGEIDFLIYEDRQKLLKDSLFDYSGDSINRHFLMISHEIKKVKRFSSGYIEKLILHASSFTVSYLTRPNWALSRFIFEEEKDKSGSEVKQILNYLYYYPHVKKIISAYIDKKKILNMTSKEFSELLNQIDSLTLEGDYMKVISESLNSMADFFNIGVSKKSLIPLKAVELFLSDKLLSEHKKKLGLTLSDPNITKYEIQDYERILSSVVYEKLETFIETEDETRLESEEIIEVAHADKINYVTDSVEGEAARAAESIEEQIQAPADDSLEEVSYSPEDIEVAEIEDDTTLESEKILEANELVREVEEEEILKSERIEDELFAGSHAGEDIEEEENLGPEKVIDDAEEIYLKETSEPLSEVDMDADDIRIDSLVIEEPEDQKEEDHLEVDNTEITFYEDSVPISDEDGILPNEHEEYSPMNEDKQEEIINEAVNDIEDEDNDEPLSLFKDLQEEEVKKEESRLDEIQKEVLREMNESIEPARNSRYESTPSINLSEMLENKKMTRILDAVFDYDMEEFANSIEKISECSSKAEAYLIIDKLCESAHLSTTSKEAKMFKSVISDYFDRR